MAKETVMKTTLEIEYREAKAKAANERDDVYCHSTWKVRVGGGRECSFLITSFLCSVHTIMISSTATLLVL